MGGGAVSTIIPAYRAAHLIRRPIDSLLSQTRPPDEILVVDDGSPDDLAGALASYGDRVTLLRKPNGGAASARNLGIERARGDFISFLDADDYWEPFKLERQLEVFLRHPEVGLAASRWYKQEPGGPRSLETHPPSELLDRVIRTGGPAAFHLASCLWTSAIVVRRVVLGEHRFTTGLEPAEDQDLWVRLVASSPAYMISDPLATYVLEPGSLCRSNLDRDFTSQLRVLRRHRPLLGPGATRRWEAIAFKRWAGNHLAQGRPRAALAPAWERLRREPASPHAWWMLLKCGALASTPPWFRRPGKTPHAL
jgi:glycosyltransferase involved in cell wall biosynthesis